jgi:hypothetical protein
MSASEIGTNLLTLVFRKSPLRLQFVRLDRPASKPLFLAGRYVQIMATVFTFDSLYATHSSHYQTIVAICRA